MALASDGSRYGAPYEIDLGMTAGIREDLAAESILLLDENAATVRRSDNLSTLSRKYFRNYDTLPVQLIHETDVLSAFVYMPHTNFLYAEAWLNPWRK